MADAEGAGVGQVILVTGAAGFIGSAVVWELNNAGRTDLVLCDRFGSSEKWKNLRTRRFEDYVEAEDLFRRLADASWAGKVEAVLHIGACSSTKEWDMTFLHGNNVAYSQRLGEWAAERGAKFIYASSAATYGDGSLGFSDRDELTPKLEPLNPYGFSKWLVDMWAIRHDFPARAVGLRFFNVFGPNEYHKGDMASVIFNAFEKVKRERLIKLFKSHRPDFGDGEQSRDFVYVKDVARVVRYFLERPETQGIYNVGTGKARSFNDLAKALFGGLDLTPNIEYFDMPEELRDKYQYFTEADLAKLREAGYTEEFTPLEDAVDDYVRNYLAQDYRRL